MSKLDCAVYSVNVSIPYCLMTKKKTVNVKETKFIMTFVIDTFECMRDWIFCQFFFYF